MSGDVPQIDHGVSERKATTLVRVGTQTKIPTIWKESLECAGAILAPLAATLLAVVVTGCASTGHSFNYAAADSLELGQMRSSEYRNVFGEKPSAIGSQSTSDGKFEIARYTYAYADMGNAEARTLVLEFKNGDLNAYQHLSSFTKDKTTAAVENADQVKNGISTKNDVLDILGKPNGKARCPSVLDDFKGRCSKGVEVWSWMAMKKLSTFGSAYGGARPKVNMVFVIFDANGVVAETEISQTK
jgi:hypothetical protein